MGATFAKLAVRVRLFGLALVQSLPLIGAIVIGVAALAALAVGIRKLALESMGLTKEVENLNKASEKTREISKENESIFEEIRKARKGESDSIKTQTALNTAAANATGTQSAAM